MARLAANELLRGIGSDNPPQLVFLCGNDRCDKLRETCSESDDSHTDDEGRDLELFCGSRASVDEEVGAFYQQEETANEQNIFEHRDILSLSVIVVEQPVKQLVEVSPVAESSPRERSRILNHELQV